MKRLKIYLDTSVLSHLKAPDAPKEQDYTLRLWAHIKAGIKYETFISPITFLEILNCPQPKQSFMWKQLRIVPHTMVTEDNDEAIELAAKYLEAGLLPRGSNRDRLHIAYACVYNCDMIVSWNFKHMVNYKTISGVKSVNAMAGYREMPIFSPTMLIEGGADHD